MNNDLTALSADNSVLSWYINILLIFCKVKNFLFINYSFLIKIVFKLFRKLFGKFFGLLVSRFL